MTNREMEKVFKDEVLIHNKIIYKVCHQYTNSPEDFNDLYQEVMLQLWKSFPNFRSKSKISTWVYKVALNTSLYFLRKEKRHVPTVDLIKECYKIPENDLESTKDKMDIIKRMLGGLSDIERAVIMLHLDNYSYEEISSIIGMSKTNIATRINRIKNKLKNGK